MLGSEGVTHAALGRLPLTEASMRETLRLLPPSTLSFRELTQDVELDGYVLPKGWIVIAGDWLAPSLFRRSSSGWVSASWCHGVLCGVRP